MFLDYTRSAWRDDLRKLIRNAGSLRKDTVLYVYGSEMLRHDFLLNDVDALLASGEVPGIFSTDEKHELNEVKIFLFTNFLNFLLMVFFLFGIVHK